MLRLGSPAIDGVWPPAGIETCDPWHLPFINTLILLLSGCAATWAHHALQVGDRKAAKRARKAAEAGAGVKHAQVILLLAQERAQHLAEAPVHRQVGRRAAGLHRPAVGRVGGERR